MSIYEVPTQTLEFVSSLWYSVAMINKEDIEEDANLVGSSTEVFVKYYNKNIPDTFPRATLKTLEKFQTVYPSLFKENYDWIINKHRKKFMDWLSSYQGENNSVKARKDR